MWRGYVAEWAIDDGQLYLVRLTGWLHDESVESSLQEVGLESVFPGIETQDGRVLAAWFSGELEAEPAEVAASVQPARSDPARGVFGGWLTRDLETELGDTAPELHDSADTPGRVFSIGAGRVIAQPDRH